MSPRRIEIRLAPIILVEGEGETGPGLAGVSPAEQEQLAHYATLAGAVIRADQLSKLKLRQREVELTIDWFGVRRSVPVFVVPISPEGLRRAIALIRDGTVDAAVQLGGLLHREAREYTRGEHEVRGYAVVRGALKGASKGGALGGRRAAVDGERLDAIGAASGARKHLLAKTTAERTGISPASVLRAARRRAKRLKRVE